jgi:aspartate 1-decarboxylase
MLIRVLRAKLHRAAVTACEVDYVGSITIDMDLVDAAGLVARELVLLPDLPHRRPFEPHVMAGPRGSGTVCINGAAAKLAAVGDRVIVMAWAYVQPEEARRLEPTVVVLNERNEIQQRL